MFCLFGKFLCIMVRIRVSNWVRVSVRDRVRFLVSIMISDVSIKCCHVANVLIIHTHSSCMSKQ